MDAEVRYCYLPWVSHVHGFTVGKFICRLLQNEIGASKPYKQYWFCNRLYVCPPWKKIRWREDCHHLFERRPAAMLRGVGNYGLCQSQLTPTVVWSIQDQALCISPAEPLFLEGTRRCVVASAAHTSPCNSPAGSPVKTELERLKHARSHSKKVCSSWIYDG